jgi:prepilin-type N-terminal cleavage/methylation domain-containing protein
MLNAWAKKQKGFTIVELVIIIVVIAILASIGLVADGSASLNVYLCQARKRTAKLYLKRTEPAPLRWIQTM